MNPSQFSNEIDTESEKISFILAKSAPGAFSDRGECIKPLVSFEFFPPRTEKGVDNLIERMKRFSMCNPAFTDFTWGAGGSTSDLTLKLTLEAKDNCSLIPNMHLTCTNMAKKTIDDVLDLCLKNGVRNIVALRGDPPAGTNHWEVSEEGFSCALDLVTYIKKKYCNFFCISVAGYPEGHPDSIHEYNGSFDSLSKSEKLRCNFNKETGKIAVCSDEDWERELAYLKAKCDAGADVIITQMFFDSSVYGSFVDDCRRVGITVPIIPGILCLNTFAGFQRMTTLCKTRVPEMLREKINSFQDDDAALKEFGIEYGYELCDQLLKLGAPDLHFYTLNLEQVTMGILNKLHQSGRYEFLPPKA